MFYKETETVLIGEYYLLSALKDSEKLLQIESFPNTGRFVFTKGIVNYECRPLSETIDVITYTLRLSTNEEWQAIAHYDHEQLKMVEWIEWN